ncbi:MAG: tetratricopeptide repeat protein [Bacteroidales bacterium]|nr:tetratricopeptide repeat protein [Bacteroidales bacterium]
MKEYINNTSWATALVFLLCIGCKQEKSSQFYYSQAVKEFKEEKYNEAYNSFTKAIEQDTTYGQAYFMRAQVLGLLNASKDSICENLSKADELGYKEAKEVMEKYCKVIPSEEFNRLKLNFDEFIRKNPDRFEGYYDRANLYFDAGNFQNAIIDYNKAIEKKEYPVAYYNRGLCYIKLGMKDDGCKDIRKSVELGYAVEKGVLEFCN